MTNQIKELSNELETLIVEHLPQIWNDGDIRYLEKSLYSRIYYKYEYLQSLRAYNLGNRVSNVESNAPKSLVYIGHFGVIEIKPVD